jgi:deoxyribonuclease V
VAATVIINLEDLEIIETRILEVELLFSYKPGFLGFREANAMVLSLNSLKMDYDVVMVNGHGVLHPRGFGLASHVGIMIDKPTLGVQKD